MAKASITRRWADDSACCVEVEVEGNYPDAVAEAVANVIRLDREATPDDAELPDELD